MRSGRGEKRGDVSTLENTIGGTVHDAYVPTYAHLLSTTYMACVCVYIYIFIIHYYDVTRSHASSSMYVHWTLFLLCSIIIV